jgi:hypothetical protein
MSPLQVPYFLSEKVRIKKPKSDVVRMPVILRLGGHTQKARQIARVYHFQSLSWSLVARQGLPK